MKQPDQTNADFNRRDFIKGSSFAALMTMMGGVQLMTPSATAREISTMAAKPKVKVGIIGLGPWGRDLLDQLGRLEQADIAAICDNYPAMVRRSASKAPGAEQVEDYQAIIANKDIKAVVVATGSNQHKDIVLAALAAVCIRTAPARLLRSVTAMAASPSAAAVSTSSWACDAPRRKLKLVVTCSSA